MTIDDLVDSGELGTWNIEVLRFGGGRAVSRLDPDTWKFKERLLTEIHDCDVRIEGTEKTKHKLLIAEKEALAAELEYKQARLSVDDKSERLAKIYEQYGLLGINEENYEEYLIEAAGDEFEWIKVRDFLEPMINPQQVGTDLAKLQKRATELDRSWRKKLDVWHRKHNAWHEEIDHEPTTQAELIAFSVHDGKIRVALQRTDGSWTDVGVSRLPSGIYLAGISPLTDVLAELEELINMSSVSEKDLQEFFERHRYLLQGKDYDVVIPQASIVSDEGDSWRADFVLHPFDQLSFCKVLEIKPPQLPIQRTDKSGHGRFFSHLVQAIGQVKDYAEAFASPDTRTRFQEKYGIHVYRPEAQIIIGRRKHIKTMRHLLDLQHRNFVQISDWDTYLERLRRQRF
jgi:hypothetical protein